MSAWQEYKDRLGTTRPWDLLNPNVEKVSEDVAQARLNVCERCPELIRLTKQCKKCGCIMPAKVRIKEATCPIGKW